MSWLVPRILAGVLAMVVGALVGMLAGHAFNAPLVGELLGGACAVAVFATFDTMRGARLVEWLRGSQEDQAPRDTGFWGELGYRIERSIRQRELGLAQEQMRLTQFLSAIEASPNGVLMLDASDQIEWCNSVAAEHFGLDPQRDRRQRVTNLVRTPAFVACLQGEPVAGQDGDATVTYPNPRGPGTLSVLIRRYGEGMKLVISQDITERERAEAMRRDFVANVSHEIRTPLTVLAGFIETMATLKLSDVERQRVLQLMTQQAVRMQELVSDLLTLAQLEGSPRPPGDRWVALDPLLARVEADALALSNGRHAIAFARATGVQVAGAEKELLSAVVNLVNNAVRYTQDGGRIDLVHWRMLTDGYRRDSP